MPAVVGSLIVQSANLLAGFSSHARFAIFAICTQKVRFVISPGSTGQQLGSIVGDQEVWPGLILDQQTL
jgi:hypothetical protein